MTINLEENAHAKAQRGQDAKEEKQASSSLPLRLRPFAPLREPSAPSPFLLGLLVGLTAVLAGEFKEGETVVIDMAEDEIVLRHATPEEEPEAALPAI